MPRIVALQFFARLSRALHDDRVSGAKIIPIRAEEAANF
jgi:hypothetical protein